MLDRVTRPADSNVFLTMGEARDRAAVGDQALGMLKDWVESYLTSAHPELGRTGAVCPFTRQASKLDAVRLAICDAKANREGDAFAMIRRAFAELEAIPCKPTMRHFRTVIIGFPNCDGAEGVAMLANVQRRHKFYSLSRFRMIGFMHAGNDAPGLWNPEFRPLRAPLPVLAVRHLVEQDAPFAARHPLLLIPFLMRFPIAGPRRLLAYARSASARKA